MRKVIICDNLTSDIYLSAQALEIPEIITGIPLILKTFLQGINLPCVVVESSNHPRTYLFAKNMATTTKAEIDAVVDLPPIIPAPSTVDKLTGIINVDVNMANIKTQWAAASTATSKLSILESILKLK
jgi:hypothetical protein